MLCCVTVVAPARRHLTLFYTRDTVRAVTRCIGNVSWIQPFGKQRGCRDGLSVWLTPTTYNQIHAKNGREMLQCGGRGGCDMTETSASFFLKHWFYFNWIAVDRQAIVKYTTWNILRAFILFGFTVNPSYARGFISNFIRDEGPRCICLASHCIFVFDEQWLDNIIWL